MPIDHDLIADLLPAQEVSILAGASGSGKTTLIMTILAALQRGESPFGFVARHPLRIGYIAADRTWRSYQRTAALVKLDLGGIAARTLIDDPSINLAAFEQSPITELERLISTLLPLDLLVVDPLVVFLGVDTNKYHLSAARLIRLNKLCAAQHLTLLGTHHATKARTDYAFKRPQDRISGTSALLGFTSTQLFLACPEETGREDHLYEWHIISHHAPGRVILLARDDQGRFAQAGDVSATDPLPLAEHMVRVLASQGRPLLRRELMTLLDTSASPSTIDRTAAALLASGVIARTEFGYTLTHTFFHGYPS